MTNMDDPDREEELEFLRREVRRLRAALNRLTPGLEVMLKRRGFVIFKKEPSDDLFVPAKEFREEFYRLMHKYSFRLFLRDVIKHQEGFSVEEVARYAALPVTKEYIDFLVSVKLIKKRSVGYVLAGGPVTSFGTTLEWYIAEVFRREFHAEAVWGVKFRRPRVGGDYDVIAKFEGSLIYVEVKSSPPKQIYDSEVAAFLDRVADLAPELAVFLIDTELRMKDKLVPMFEKELRKRFAGPPQVERMERELFHIRDRVFIVNAKESIIGNIEKAASRHFQKTTGLVSETTPGGEAGRGETKWGVTST